MFAFPLLNIYNLLFLTAITFYNIKLIWKDVEYIATLINIYIVYTRT